MAGHSKWANIKHRKARVDAKRSKMWSKCSRAIIVAAKNGGGDPGANTTLRYAIEEAKFHNMPKDTIERAVKKGTGELGDGSSYDDVRYEGYAPGGVAIIVDSLTDNRNRTATEVRTIFNKGGGSLGSTGCVSYMFEPKGIILVEQAGAPDEDRLMELAVEAGADDVELDGDTWTISTEATELMSVKEALEASGVKCSSAELTLVPDNTVKVEGADAHKVLRFIEELDDHDDVQKVWANLDVSDEDLATFEG